MTLFKHLQLRSNETRPNGPCARAAQMAVAVWRTISWRFRLAGALLLFISLAISLSSPTVTVNNMNLPSISLEYQYKKQTSEFNESKVALLIEDRPLPVLVPLMVHFISVVPPDWRFRFMGSAESVEYINKSVAIREQVSIGKLDLTYIPANMSTGSQEEISRFLTNLWLYEVHLQPAEWLLVFQTDSILCANSRQNLNDYLEYDWVGAPWNVTGRFGGNGGLSLRRVSAIVDVLRNQQRTYGTDPEDVWLTDRLGHRPGAKLANGTISSTFSGEMHSGKHEHVDHDSASTEETVAAAEAGAYVEGVDDWRDGFYEPMGYHTGGSGRTLHSAIWGTPALRKHIWDYCPEIKMTLAMDVAKFVPGSCGGYWKRDHAREANGVPGAPLESNIGYDTEVINDEEYPLLPELVPW